MRRSRQLLDKPPAAHAEEPGGETKEPLQGSCKWTRLTRLKRVEPTGRPVAILPGDALELSAPPADGRHSGAASCKACRGGNKSVLVAN